ncbi:MULTISPECIES: FMN-binding protein [unclassified Ectothiorhodospira]|uniref:FMN-binding protein n=1 Tax=unclassified Ectothiorhodospira TaxID=2684909 RepID=UPI001EE85591|nr:MULTISPECIES: FMN-binding protein [unclassified Ectothiorhodospira]MCG5515346.1 FMN-binding protein [Ectothiorhodospira sp. 9100]MCG5519224.1 FMN-binding protein [Ectothiorhodospira sp. 9905]
MSSSASVQPQRPKPTSSVKLITTLGLIALFSGLLVVSVFEFTKPYIAENQRIALERAVLEVIPGAVERRDFILTDEGVFPRDQAPESGSIIHAGFDEAGRFQGVALEASGRGYADVIRVLYGYDPSCQCIVGMTVLESRETPGLGDKIETDPSFVANFERLDARLAADGSGLANRIRTVDPGAAEQPWEIDGITGATISAEAIGNMLNRSADSVLPELAPHWAAFEQNN